MSDVETLTFPLQRHGLLLAIMCQQQHCTGREHGQQHRQPETEGQGVQHEPGADRQLKEETDDKRGRRVAPSCHDPQQRPSTRTFSLCGLEGSEEKQSLKQTSKAAFDVNGGHIFGRAGKTRFNSTLEKRKVCVFTSPRLTLLEEETLLQTSGD